MALVAVAIVFASILVLVVPTRSVTEARADWSYYSVTAGPGIDTNTSTIQPPCHPSGAIDTAVISMTWSTSTGKPVELVRIWALEYATPTNLYVAWNASMGGWSFLANNPTLCSQPWVLTVGSNQTVTVNAVLAVTYNVTGYEPLL